MISHPQVERFPDPLADYTWRYFLWSPWTLMWRDFLSSRSPYATCGKIIWSLWETYVEIFPDDRPGQGTFAGSEEVRSWSQTDYVWLIGILATHVEWFSVVRNEFWLFMFLNNRDLPKWSSTAYVEWFPVKSVMIQDVKKRILCGSEINMWRFFLICLFRSLLK